jgi:hypothetical protein
MAVVTGAARDLAALAFGLGITRRDNDFGSGRRSHLPDRLLRRHRHLRHHSTGQCQDSAHSRPHNENASNFAPAPGPPTAITRNCRPPTR